MLRNLQKQRKHVEKTMRRWKTGNGITMWNKRKRKQTKGK